MIPNTTTAKVNIEKLRGVMEEGNLPSKLKTKYNIEEKTA